MAKNEILNNINTGLNLTAHTETKAIPLEEIAGCSAIDPRLAPIINILKSTPQQSHGDIKKVYHKNQGVSIEKFWPNKMEKIWEGPFKIREVAKNQSRVVVDKGGVSSRASTKFLRGGRLSYS